MTEQRNHAILSASSAHRWLHCTPSARLELEEGKEECSAFAAEGTAAHALAELKLNYRFGKIGITEYNEKYDEFKMEADHVGAGDGDRVLLVTGTVASRFCMEAPVDAAVVAIIDQEGKHVGT